MNNSYYIALKQQILNKVVLTFKRYLPAVNETPIVWQPQWCYHDRRLSQWEDFYGLRYCCLQLNDTRLPQRVVKRHCKLF
jgi:hypothetical protein